MVFTVLHPRPEALSRQEPLKVDIIAVHGLNGDPVKTWTDKKTGAYWLRDYLPVDIKSARVMTYGYNADGAFGNTVADVMDYAKDLLNGLVDKREREEESHRPIIFIAHSLGGIIVKQALTASHVDARFQTIKERTVGIAFFGTPHRGSAKASYGKVLASVATTVMHRPSSKLIDALQSKGDTLQRLNSDFRFQLVNYQILTFYETRAMSIFSKPIVEKYSALLEVPGEEQVMVDSNHKDMCKFASKEDDIYDKLVKRIRRILAGETTRQINPSKLGTISEPFNRYYEVPYNVSSMFTGRDDILQKLYDTCVPRQEPPLNRQQQRYVIHGLGGSGKTQICLKFAETSREKFWGIFFIDASSASAVKQELLAISKKCKVEQSVEGVKRWFSNQTRPWLLIFDNADDPELDIARFFPTGDRGAILITTRNPECRVHATAGSSKLDRMELNDALTLLLRASFVIDPENKTARNSAKHIVETLGCLALAIVHAGATIRQGVCTLDDYCTEYSRHRKQLLDCRPVQAGTDYEHTVYSTWEVSIEKIGRLPDKAAKYAIDLLNFFSVLHFEGISEKILKKACENLDCGEFSTWEETHIRPILNQDCSEKWNSQPFRDAVRLLSSYSLIHIDGTENQISLHPLVHTWIRDRLPSADRSRYYIMSIVTLSKSLRMNFETTDLSYVSKVQKHIDSCLLLCQNELWVEDSWSKDRISMAAAFGYAYEVGTRYEQARDILERTLDYSKRTMNEKYLHTLHSTYQLGVVYQILGEREKGIDLLEKAFTTARATLGPEDSRTLFFMRQLAFHLSKDNCLQEAIDLIEELQILEKKVYRDGDVEIGESMVIYAEALSRSGNHQKALDLLKDAILILEEQLITDHVTVLYLKDCLAHVYSRLNRWQEAAEVYQQLLESRIRVFGTGHRENLIRRLDLAVCYEKLDRPQDGLRILTEITKISRENYGHDDPRTIMYVRKLKEMQARYDQSLAEEAAESSSSSRWTLKRMFERRRRS